MLEPQNNLFLTQTLIEPVLDPTCRINISGYALKNYKLMNPDGFTIMCETGKYCDFLKFFPNTNTIVLEGNRKTHLLFTDFQNRFIPDLAQKLDVSPESAMAKSFEFFHGKEIVVQPTGLQGMVYNTMRSLQNYIAFDYSFKAVSIAKTTGITGFQIIKSAPLTFVGVTYVGSIFFGYCGSVAGDNAFGVAFNATSFALSRPMRGLELVANGLLLTPISNRIGLPALLNGTKEVISGKGLKLTDFTPIGFAFERVANITSTSIKKVKKTYNIVKSIWQN